MEALTGLLLINLGTPDEPTTPAVRRYLRQFLSDPRVIDINPVGRFMLLNLVILPFRPKKSAHAYQQIWTERGSPLLFHSEDLTKAVAERLGEGWSVQLGMRYGSPSIKDALIALGNDDVDKVVVLPLFPQFAASSTRTALEETTRQSAKVWDAPHLAEIESFYDHPGFIEAFGEVGKKTIDETKPDHILFSFHGLPERHIKAEDDTGEHCLVKTDCCAQMTETNQYCYRAHCYSTARGIAAKLELSEDDYTVCFQSRLGRTPWIKPYTDVLLDELGAAGKKRLAVFCPAFVADCLETLEEIGMRAKDQFVAAGGEELVLIPSLNSEPTWADAVADMARAAVG